MDSQATDHLIRVGTSQQLEEKGCIVVSGDDRPIAVFAHEGKVRAVDNRCPHMGFPLHKGTVQDGILTCHWHHARFDLTSGCTFDLFADDVPTYPVEIREGDVWVNPRSERADEAAHWRQRLEEGMAQNIPLIIAKGVIGLLKAGVDYEEILQSGVLFGCRYRDGWGVGLTILSAMANLVPSLPEEEQFLALYQGLRRTAADCVGQVPRRDRHALETDDLPLHTLKRWFRYWTLVRHRDGAERTLLTAIRGGASPAELADLLFTAATDRFYSNTGHVLDFINKALDSLDLIGWEHAEAVLPTVVGQLVAGRGGEEMNSWRHPIDLVPLVESASGSLERWMQEGQGNAWDDEAGLAARLLADDPEAIISAVGDAVRAGAQPTQLGKSVCYAAALRIARFGTANEFADWITALHTFTYCNAFHRGMKRVATLCSLTNPDLLRGVLHGAMSIYLDRFLNVPSAHLPGERLPVDAEPAEAAALCEELLDTLDSQHRVEEGAKIVAAYLSQNHPLDLLTGALAHGVLREDADFHTFQMLEASLRQYEEWGNSPEGRNILIALTRYIAAHSPTERAQLQTAQIALRLHRGEALYVEE